MKFLSICAIINMATAMTLNEGPPPLPLQHAGTLFELAQFDNSTDGNSTDQFQVPSIEEFAKQDQENGGNSTIKFDSDKLVDDDSFPDTSLADELMKTLDADKDGFLSSSEVQNSFYDNYKKEIANLVRPYNAYKKASAENTKIYQEKTKEYKETYTKLKAKISAEYKAASNYEEKSKIYAEYNKVSTAARTKYYADSKAFDDKANAAKATYKAASSKASTENKANKDAVYSTYKDAINKAETQYNADNVTYKAEREASYQKYKSANSFYGKNFRNFAGSDYKLNAEELQKYIVAFNKAEEEKAQQ